MIVRLLGSTIWIKLGGCDRESEESKLFFLPDEGIFKEKNFSCWGECKDLENGILKVKVI